MTTREIAERFETFWLNSQIDDFNIVVDKATGVQYLFFKDSAAGGLTPLIDRDGKPLLDPDYAK